MSEVATTDDLPTDPPRTQAGRPVWLPWWLPLWVLATCSLGVLVIGVAMALVITMPI